MSDSPGERSMKPVKVIGLLVAGLVALGIVAALLILLLVNPNDFKPRIEAAVKSSTGRELSLQGDIKLSVFPWVALTLGPASLGNPPGFGDAPFLSFSRAEVRVKLLPLLAKRLEVARVTLDGLDLRLVKKPDGQANWQMNDKSAAPGAEPDGSRAPALESVAGIAVTRGRISYNEYLIDNLHFETGAISTDPGTRVTRIAALDLQGDLHRPTGAALHCALNAPQIDVNPAQQTLSVPAFSIGLADAKLSGKLSGTRVMDDAHFAGAIALAPLDLRDFAFKLAFDVPKSRDPKALTYLSASMDMSYGGNVLKLDHLQMTLDDTTLRGAIGVAMAKTDSVDFNLAADHIDLDRYRPPAPTAAPASTAAPVQPSAAASPESAPLAARGAFTLGAAHAAGVDLTNLSVTLDMADKVTHLHPLSAQLYGGRFAGDLTYDARTPLPAITMDEHLTGVDVAQLLANTKAKGRVSGKANIDFQGTARGAAADEIMKTLNGHFAANLAGGALDGIDVGYQLALAQALLDKQPGTAVANTHKTAFDAFKVSAQIINGVADTKDLLISSAVLRVVGQGTVSLPTSALDMTLTASIMKAANRTAVDIPLKVTGPYTDPSVKPDLTALAKGQLKQKALDVLKKNGLDLNSLFKKK